MVGGDGGHHSRPYPPRLIQSRYSKMPSSDHGACQNQFHNSAHSRNERFESLRKLRSSGNSRRTSITFRAYPFGNICSTSHYSSSLPIRDNLLYESLLFEFAHSGLSALRVMQSRYGRML